MYLQRQLEGPLKKALEQFPAVLITGPRQAGKSTLLQTCLPEHTYVTLDDAQACARALADPKLFFSTHPRPLIIDEIQYAPELLSYVKILIDQERDRKGQFVLTGSQVFQLMEGVSESLAGRVCIFHLYPMSWQELNQNKLPIDDHDDLQVAERIVQGFYPEIIKDPKKIDWNHWYGSYISTYLERDLRNIRAITDLNLFQNFLSLLATRVGSLLNLSEIGKECGISQPTAKSWVSILESTYLIFRLRPYFRNHSKRIVRAPKLYFVDTGLACFLLGIDSPERFLRASERGQLFENMVIAEWLKRTSWVPRPHPLHFYRTPAGLEIDLLIERREQMAAFEIKLAKSLNSRMVQPLQYFLQDRPEARGYLLSLSEERALFADNIEALHWSEGFDVID